MGASAIKAAIRLDIPVISGFHTNFHTYSNHYRLGWLAPAILAYLRRLHNKTLMTLVPTRTLAEDLNKRGFKKVEVMQRGVDTTLFTPTRRDENLRKAWNANEDSIVCLYVGRIAPEKNIHTAVETVVSLYKHYNIRFVLVGDGPLREKLENRYPDFVFCGTRLGEDLATHYASADILLFPSRTETFGNVVTEAMASGLATVAYNEAAAHEHITSWHNGVLADDKPSQSFTSVTMRLCKQPELIRGVGKNACEYTQKLGWPIIVSRFEGLLRSACDDTSAFNQTRE
jgi:glycosyltransferase involved in cell wall biosynthesis